MTVVSKIRYRRFENKILRSVTTTDCEQYNQLRQLLEDTRNSLRAYLELLQKNDSTWRSVAKRTRKLTRAFVRNFPGDHADHRVVSKATIQALQAAPESAIIIDDKERADVERGTMNAAAPVVTKLVHDYLSELDSFYVTKFHRIETCYRRVALHREIHKLLTGAKFMNEEKVLSNRHKLDVHVTAYQLALDEHLTPLQQLMDKRYVAFKAMRVAYWSAQLRAFDSIRDSLCTNMAGVCDNPIENLNLASQQLRNYVEAYVERISTICIKSMSVNDVQCYMPTLLLDDNCEHSFHKLFNDDLLDPRLTTPPPTLSCNMPSLTPGSTMTTTTTTTTKNERVFRVLSPKFANSRRIGSSGAVDERDLLPRNFTISSSRPMSPVSVEPSQIDSNNRNSLPLDELKSSYLIDSTITPMSPVSSLDGHTTTPSRTTTDDQHVQMALKRVMSTPRRRAVNVPWLRRKFEITPAEV